MKKGELKNVQNQIISANTPLFKKKKYFKMFMDKFKAILPVKKKVIRRLFFKSSNRNND